MWSVPPSTYEYLYDSLYGAGWAFDRQPRGLRLTLESLSGAAPRQLICEFRGIGLWVLALGIKIFYKKCIKNIKNVLV